MSVSCTLLMHFMSVTCQLVYLTHFIGPLILMYYGISVIGSMIWRGISTIVSCQNIFASGSIIDHMQNFQIGFFSQAYTKKTVFEDWLFFYGYDNPHIPNVNF